MPVISIFCGIKVLAKFSIIAASSGEAISIIALLK